MRTIYNVFIYKLRSNIIIFDFTLHQLNNIFNELHFHTLPFYNTNYTAYSIFTLKYPPCSLFGKGILDALSIFCSLSEFLNFNFAGI